MQNATVRLIRTLIASLWERRDGVSFRGHLRFLSRSQYWPDDRRHAYQEERLNRLLRHAYIHCPWYQERLRSTGYNPEHEWRISDLPRLPILEKEDIRLHQENMIADNVPRSRLRPKRTGGSTSVPLHLFVDNHGFARKTAATWRHNRWAGYDIGEWLAMVWGATSPPPTLRGKFRLAAYERYFALDTLAMTEENIRSFLALCKRKKPRILLGHAHSVYLLADFCRGAQIDDVHFDSVITTAMVLLPRERKTIEDAFRTNVFNRYGCEELSVIASECEVHRGLHLHAEGLIAEVVQGHTPMPSGEFGDLVLTDLDNYGMPFIRYRIGDVAALAEQPCPCGRTLPLLVDVRGRTADFLYTPEGNRVFGISILDTLMIHIPGVRQAQIIQDTIDELVFRLAIDPGTFAAGGQQRLQEELPVYFGPRMRYRFEFVDRIPPEKNGKYRFAICRLHPEQGNAQKESAGDAPGDGVET